MSSNLYQRYESQLNGAWNGSRAMSAIAELHLNPAPYFDGGIEGPMMADASISKGGNRLLSFLDDLPVKTSWLAGHHIVWQTGQQNGPDGVGRARHSHCSAFVAAVALYLDIYILRPPHHAQEGLANAQMMWLSGQSGFSGPSALDAGWEDLGYFGDGGARTRAVTAANAGRLVIAGCQQPAVVDPVTGRSVDKPGHLVVLRPQVGTLNFEAGPLVTMAGERNWRAIHMAHAFTSHPGAWPNAIRLFAHDTDLQTDYAAPPVVVMAYSTSP